MKTLRGSVVLFALCSLFASSLVRADDCSDALMAESCACRSDVKSEREQPRTSDKGSLTDHQSKIGKAPRRVSRSGRRGPTRLLTR